ncbi:MAG: molybdopterin-dependent oxidoreductase, partial [Ferruginibacter sp.]
MNHKEEIVTRVQVRNRTFISLLVLFGFLALCIVGWKWLQKQPTEQAALKPLRKALNVNESIFTSLFFSNNHLVKTYPKELAVPRVRVNGSAGMSEDFDPSTWKLTLVKKPGDTLLISIDEIKKLPKTEIIFDFKCIEGWSQVTHWGGVRFSDFAKSYGLDEQVKLQFTGLVTPDEEYYVGIDNKSMMHPQTLL